MSNGPGFFDDDPGAAQPPSASNPARDEDDGTFADVLNSFTLDSGRKRRKGKKRKDQGNGSHASAHETSWHAPPPVEREEPVEWPETEPPPARPNGLFEQGASTADGPRVNAEPAAFAQAEDTGFVRPYAITGGRTQANHALELETLITTQQRGGATMAAPEQVEHRSIVEECRTPRSVAEIASTLRVPIGVARVLISDAADAGLVTVHRTISGDGGAEEHMQLMERVLSGLRRL